MIQRTLSLALVLCLSLTMGCTTVQKYAAAGAAGGAVIGGLWGSNGGGSLNAGEGAAVGAAAGGLVGALVGDGVAQGEANARFEKEIDDRDAQIAKLQEENRALMTKHQACEEELKVAKRKIDDLTGQIANLTDELAKCKGSRVELTLLADVLFAPGKARLTEQGRKALTDAAEKIKNDHPDTFITVEGHTDSDPIRASGWKDNWDLGAARSMAVLRFLIDKGIDPAKASAETFSQYQPVADNGSKDGKKQNRRAVIVIHTGWPKKH